MDMIFVTCSREKRSNISDKHLSRIEFSFLGELHRIFYQILTMIKSLKYKFHIDIHTCISKVQLVTFFETKKNEFPSVICTNLDIRMQLSRLNQSFPT